MRVWLFACVIAVLVAAGVAAAVVVLPGGEGEEPVEREAESAVGETPTFRYNRLDITGAVTTPGSLAFLQMAGNPFSAVPKFAFSAFGVVELRIHPVDADGISRADFYDTVRVNDTVDYRTWWPNGLNCASRFKVTSVGATASPRTFGIEHVPLAGTCCAGTSPRPVAPRACTSSGARLRAFPARTECGGCSMASRPARAPIASREECHTSSTYQPEL